VGERIPEDAKILWTHRSFFMALESVESYPRFDDVEATGALDVVECVDFFLVLPKNDIFVDIFFGFTGDSGV